MRKFLLYFKEKKELRPYFVLFFILACVPFGTTSRYIFTTLIFFGIYLLLSMGLNLMIGGVGLFALCSPLFFGVGAYTSALVSTELGFSFLVGLALAMIFSAITAYVAGTIALRVAHHSFAILTLAFLVIAQLIAYNWVSLTRGPMGIPGIPKPYISLPFGRTLIFDTPVRLYYLMFILIIISVLVFYRIQNSRLGRTFVSIREDEPLAEAYGVNTKKYKITAFVIGAIFGGIAGSYYAHYIQFVSPEIFGEYLLCTLLIIVIMGGVGYVEGTIIGAFLFTVIPEALRLAPETRDLIYSIMLIIIVIKAPEGIYGKYRERMRRKRLQKKENTKKEDKNEGEKNEVIT